MNFRKYLPLILQIVFFCLVFVLAITPPNWDFDIWFHLKSGEVISQKGLINYDVFSYITKDRVWFPYEWLFQITVYYFKSLFGFESIKYLVSLVATLITFFVFRILRKVFDLNQLTSMIIAFFFMSSIFEFLSPRPHLFAYLFLIINLYLIFQYFFKGKNLLFLTIPVTLAWSNLHGSIFLNVYFFLSFSVISLINHVILALKKDNWLNKFKTLGIYSLVTAIATILPPLYTMQYQLLLRFYKEREVITRYISEWTPPTSSDFVFRLYLGTILIIITIFLYVIIRQKLLKLSLWVLPFLPLIFSPFLASRNSVLGYLALSLILGYSVSKIKFFTSKFWKGSWLLIAFIIILFHGWMLASKKREQSFEVFYYPLKATQFIKDYNFSGNMFNEYGYGGYLLYHLYPKQKVFIDGRTDLYLCCEMKDTLELSYNKNLPDQDYKKILDKLWDKYNVSFVLMRTEKHVVLRKIGKILQDDPSWSLVYWDDQSQIFVKKDGKNDDILKKFETIAATPYNKDPYQQGQMDQALSEYQKMVQFADSAKSRNAIGYILLQQKKLDQARKEFEKAIQLNPLNESPYMNLGELAANSGDLESAISFYNQALKLAPDRGLIYIRLGQLILKEGGNINQAKQIWQQGFKKTVDDEAKGKLKELLAS